jgi:4-amino-4-deoxy-L-arabinose transferase-like glycosyltransferase
LSTLPPGPAEVRRDLLWLAVGAALLFLPFLGARDLWNPNEPIYGLAVVEMEQRGDWLTPTVNGRPFAEKPILYYWLARAAGWLAGGIDEWSLRLPSAAAGIVAVLLLYMLVWPYAGRTRARLAAGLFATTYIVYWSARSLQMDLLLTTCTLGAILAATRVVDRDLDPRLGWMLVGLACGLGFLAKGPVGLLLPALVVTAYLAVQRRPPRLRPPAAALGVAAAALAVAPWVVPLVVRGETAYLSEILWRQSVTRFVAPWDHQAPWWYYLVQLWIDMAPWVWFLPLALRLPERDADERGLDRLAWLWILVPICFFSLSASKRSPYILPVAPAVAILVAAPAERFLAGTLCRWRRSTALALLGIFGVLALAGAGWVLRSAAPRYPALAATAGAVAVLLVAGGAGMLVGLLLRSRRAPPAALAALVVSLYLVTGARVLPAVDVYKSAGPFCDEVRARVGDDEPLRAYRTWEWRAGYAYYCRRPIPRLTSPEELRRYWARPERVHLIVERGMLDEVRSTLDGADPVLDRGIGSNHAYLFANR